MGATGSGDALEDPPEQEEKETKEAPSASPSAANEERKEPPVITYDSDGTAPTDKQVKTDGEQKDAVAEDAEPKSKQDNASCDDKPSPAKKDGAEPTEESEKTLEKSITASHDSGGTTSTDARGSTSPTQDPGTTSPSDTKNETAKKATPEDDDDATETPDKNMEAANAAVNAILWEAGLSKAEVGKRTKIEDGEVVELDLERCEQMTELPPQIGKLKRLRTLNLSGCKLLVSLPPELGELMDLRELYLTNCHSLVSLPPEIGKLVDLNELYLTNCLSLKKLPSEIGKLENLNELYLTGCKQLKSLPKEIGNLANLTELKLFSCTQLESIPAEIGRLSKLTKLDLRLCERLKELPPEIGQLNKLTTFNLTGCKQLVELPRQIGDLKKLTELILKDCKQLEVLPADIKQLSQLTELILDGCTKLKKLAPELNQLSPSKGGKQENGSRSPIDRRQSGLDIIGIAAAHLEKVPEGAKKARRVSSHVPTVDLNLSDEFFQDVPAPPEPDEVISKVGEHDVLCGRGGETNHHPGNVKYRTLVKQHQLYYIEAKRLDKPRIALKIVNIIRKNGGKFLKKDVESGTWRDVGNQKAREKTSQTLREGAPELRDPSLPLAAQQQQRAFVSYDPQAMSSMQIDPEWEQMMLKKRKADMMMMQQQQQQSPRKKYKLPVHPKDGMSPAEAAMITQDAELTSDASGHSRGSRLQIIKARQANPADARNPVPGTSGDQTVIAPTGLDVVYGKGKAIQDHIGNIRFRKIVDMHRQSYHAAFRRADKTQISKEIVQWIRGLGGRFLQLDFATGQYHDVGDECARDKVSHALRSRKEASKPLAPGPLYGASPLPKGGFAPQEQAQVVADTMDIVRYLQNQDVGEVERAYYHKMQGMGEMTQLSAQQGQDPAMKQAAIAGDTSGKPASSNGLPAATVTEEGDATDHVAKKNGEPKTSAKDWPLRDVEEPHENDVLYGRGGKSNHHPGNKRFRQAVKDREFDYLRRKNKDKQLVAMEVVREWRNQDPPGRFLKKDDKTGLWHDVGDNKAREKTSQAFRENAPHHQPGLLQAGRGRLPMGFGMRPGNDIEKTLLWGNQFPPPGNGNEPPLQEGNVQLVQPSRMVTKPENEAEV